jgi:hypothetical protein
MAVTAVTHAGTCELMNDVYKKREKSGSHRRVRSLTFHELGFMCFDARDLKTDFLQQSKTPPCGGVMS